jgi:hypothetical protein
MPFANVNKGGFWDFLDLFVPYSTLCRSKFSKLNNMKTKNSSHFGVSCERTSNPKIDLRLNFKPFGYVVKNCRNSWSKKLLQKDIGSLSTPWSWKPTYCTVYIRAYLQYTYLIRCLYMNALVSSQMAIAIVPIRPTLWSAGHPTAALN